MRFLIITYDTSILAHGDCAFAFRFLVKLYGNTPPWPKWQRWLATPSEFFTCQYPLMDRLLWRVQEMKLSDSGKSLPRQPRRTLENVVPPTSPEGQKAKNSAGPCTFVDFWDKERTTTSHFNQMNHTHENPESCCCITEYYDLQNTRNNLPCKLFSQCLIRACCSVRPNFLFPWCLLFLSMSLWASLSFSDISLKV